MKHRIEDRVATAPEHAALAAAVGRESHFDDEVRAASLRASLAGVVCVDETGTPVGMARAVGDGLQYAYVQDVIVDPRVEGEGIATALVSSGCSRATPQWACMNRWASGGQVRSACIGE
ncbi:GNAT family N-acetyltransferase [Leucobacter sp. NPDC058333]|uniref:GNAT family N-acetyltransferase n=1 Tax=Leucobacter sp. NPDC058333 TaxID=3346450 RepID=UPI00364B9B92